MARPVIVIDDDKVTLAILEKTLSSAGFMVLTAQDGMKGLDLVQTRTPPVVIVDMLIPKLHGLELCKRIRDNAILQDVKIILMSAVYRGSAFTGVIEKSGSGLFYQQTH